MRQEALVAGGRIAATVLSQVLESAKPGVSTFELDRLAEGLILAAGARPSFKGFEDYPFASCINLNEGVVHGLPSKEIFIRKGDLVTVDLGVFYQGRHTDTARTVQVGGQQWNNETMKQFLSVGRDALTKAINQCRPGNRIGDISFAIQNTIESAGYYVIRELVGHGVGKKLHQPPSIPGYGRQGEGASLKEGKALAVEVIYATDKTEIERLADGWTLVTKNGCAAAMFEHTVLITASDPIVLTRLDNWAKIAKS
jgi:methionyl aminopeptidase